MESGSCNPADVPSGEARPWLDRFEAIYRDASGDVRAIPWAHAKPCPWVIQWMHASGRATLPAGARVMVTGCGLGNDVAAMIRMGYDAMGMDISPSAIASAQQRFPEHAAAFTVADLFEVPAALRSRFDLVVEVHTVQALPPVHRSALAKGIASLLAPRGCVLAIARGREAAIPLEAVQGPPFAMTPDELTAAFTEAGLVEAEAVEAFLDDSDQPVLRLRGVFTRR